LTDSVVISQFALSLVTMEI